MIVGVVSDTHGQLVFARQAASLLECLEVAAVLHCGDVGGSEIFALFAAWPMHAVAGNVDHDPTCLARAATRAGCTFHGRFADLQLAGRRIAIVHGDDPTPLRTAIESQLFDLVCHGHTHVARQSKHGKTLVLNPGALYRATPHTLATVDLSTLEANIIKVA